MALGKIYEEPHADLFPMHLFAEGWAWKLADKAGEDMRTNSLVFRNDGVEWYTDEQEQTRVAKKLLENLLDNSFEQVRDATTRLLDKMQERSTKLEEAVFSKYSSFQLSKEYSDYCDEVVELNSWGTLITLMEMGQESVVSQECYAHLLEKAQAVGAPEKSAEAVPLLCAPVQGTFLREKKIGAMRAAMLAQQKGIESPEVASAVKELHEKYCWVSYGYVGPEMKLVDFLSEVGDFAAKKELKKELEEVLNEDSETSKKQSELERFFKLGEYGKRLFELARTFAFQKEFRKQVLYRSFRAMVRLRKEICKRAGIGLKQLAYAMPHEIPGVLGGSFDVHAFNERMRLCVYLPYDKTILAGEEAEKFVSAIAPRQIDATARELRGQGAYASKPVEGVVKVILNAHDLGKLEAGDVLVSPATSPVMVPSMKIAGAIITDQGGLTCHAAIVSRELRVPCVIGTKIATKVLRDGEKVRVDSVNGIVKKL